jgi:two-component system sensor histidine kinase/response regulator
MKLTSQKPLVFPHWLKAFRWQLADKIRWGSSSFPSWIARMRPAGTTLQFLEKIKDIGLTEAMEDYEKRKLRIFNQLNFFQLLTGILVPVLGLVQNHKLPALIWLVASFPALVSVLVLWLNARHYHFLAQLSYFFLYPFATSIVYFSGINLGVELSFILYGILSVFFLQEIDQMLFSVGLSMVSYFVLAVICKNYTYQLATANIFFYLFNQLLAIVFIFYGLFLIKRENTGYQQSILQQKEAITANERLLQRQTDELTELNAVKNKLFSIIAHDLKSPIYALRNLFRNMQEYDLPANDIKEMVPEVVNELTYTSSLMENLLLWARSQMQADSVKAQPIDISGLIKDVARLLQLQAKAKQIRVVLQVEEDLGAFADKDMISLVLRNLLSNAIKYTPEKGTITLSAQKAVMGVEVMVRDTGKGMDQDAIEKISQNNYYTTKGTAGESGTGLGLMLCKEFLSRNGGALHIHSEPGKGSTILFTLPDAG